MLHKSSSIKKLSILVHSGTAVFTTNKEKGNTFTKHKVSKYIYPMGHFQFIHCHLLSLRQFCYKILRLETLRCFKIALILPFLKLRQFKLRVLKL